MIIDSGLSDGVKANSGRNFLYNSGRVALKKNDLESARSKAETYKQMAEEINNPFQIRLAHELQGLIALAEKDYDRAIEQFEQANLQNPYNLYRMARAYSGKKNEKNIKGLFLFIQTKKRGNAIKQRSFLRTELWVIFALVFCTPFISFAEDRKINDDVGAAQQMFPRMVMHPYGPVVITWEDERHGNTDIFFQLFGKRGQPFAGLGNLQVNDDVTEAEQSNPDVAMDYRGHFVIVWMDERSGGKRIYG